MEQLMAVLVGAVGPTGALIWFLFHTTAKTIPDIVEAQRKETSALVETFRVDLREERELRETLLRQVLERASYSCPHGMNWTTPTGERGSNGGMAVVGQ